MQHIILYTHVNACNPRRGIKDISVKKLPVTYWIIKQHWLINCQQLTLA